MVGNPFHLAQALVPAEGAEDLGHAASLFFGVEARGRRAQFGKRVGKEPDVPCAMEVAVRAVVDARGELVDNHIDARHVLTGDSAEVVPGALAQARVAALVLDYMANVHNAALAAPVTNLLVKARTVELRGDVHVSVADPSAGGVARPKLVELTQPIRAQCLVQASRKFVRPW